MADAVKKNVDGWMQRLDELLHDENCVFVAQLNQLEQKTGVKRVHFAFGKWPDGVAPDRSERGSCGMPRNRPGSAGAYKLCHTWLKRL